MVPTTEHADAGPYYTDTAVLVVSSCDSGTSGTTATLSHAMSDTAIVYESCCCDWDYRDFIEPDLPDYEPVPRNIKPRKSAPRITNHIIKQPGPMRRGNRI